MSQNTSRQASGMESILKQYTIFGNFVRDEIKNVLKLNAVRNFNLQIFLPVVYFLNSTIFNSQYNQHVPARTGEFNLPFCSVQVQVGRLGRSKPLYMSAYEVTSTSCVVEATMPPDAIRR